MDTNEGKLPTIGREGRVSFEGFAFKKSLSGFTTYRLLPEIPGGPKDEQPAIRGEPGIHDGSWSHRKI
ncbi:MAG: hypothetical protein ACE1ZZ_01650, partial [Dehalococcoidia bacterium]